MNLDWITVLGIFCIGQCVFLSLIYFIKDKKKYISSYLLISLLLIFAFDLVHDLLVHSRLILNYPLIVGWASLFTYLKGPLIFILIKSRVDSNFKFHRYDILHLGVFVIKNIENIYTEFSHDTAWKLNFLTDYYYTIDHNLPIPPESSISISDLWLIHPIIYLIIIIIYLFIKKNKLEAIKGKQLFWLRFFVIDYLAIYLLNISLYVMSSYIPFVSQFYWAFSSLQFCILIIIISYVNLNPQFYISLLPRKKVYQSSTLTEKESLEIIISLNTYIAKNSTYLIKKLSISALSKLVKTPTHHISQAVNEHKNLNFQDYINQFRIEKAKQLIDSNFSEEYTFDTLALECGFNSSTSFYRAFKKFTSLTPKQYLKEINP